MSEKLSISLQETVLSPVTTYLGFVRLADTVPMAVIQIASRVAIAAVFWKSAQSKLASWQVTEQLFALEYKIPILPPEVAATLATMTELCGAVLIFFGIFARVGALALLGVVATIQIFVYPQSWVEHLMWTSLLLLILARGAGTFSVDHVFRRYFG